MSSSNKAAAPREQFIVLLRHGIAEERTPDKPDEARTLTPEGHARMKQIARGLERILPRVQAIYASPLVRAAQSALWIAKGYRLRAEVRTTEALAPEAAGDEFQTFIRNLAERRVILVGHEPNLTQSLHLLTGIDASKIELKKGGAYGVLLHEDGRGELEWVLTPRILRRLGEA